MNGSNIFRKTPMPATGSVLNSDRRSKSGPGCPQRIVAIFQLKSQPERGLDAVSALDGRRRASPNWCRHLGLGSLKAVRGRQIERLPPSFSSMQRDFDESI